MSVAFRVVEDADLRARNTFGVAARAPVLVEVDDIASLPDAFARHAAADRPPLLLGGGSNLLFAGDPEGAVLSLSAAGIRIVDDHDTHAIVRAEAGAVWHDLVLWTLRQGLAGLENLALIPGSVGAAPIQNIGAYGVEVREFVHGVEAWEPVAARSVRLDRDACAFAYRDSRFKREADRFIVTAVEFALPRTPPLRLDYAGICEELAAMGIDAPTPMQVCDAVCRIRRRKLPDPAVIGNAGSFFKNPIVPLAQATALAAAHPALPQFRGADDHTRKLSAAWLIDACGWKGHRDGDAGVSPQHALVLVNHGHATGAELLALARRIAALVRERFGVDLEPEPRIVGARW